MDLTPHMVTGAAIGARVRRPAAMLSLAFASHYVLDTVPHFNIGWINGLTLNGAIDLGLGLVLCGIVAWKVGSWAPLAGALAAVLPDAPGLKEPLEGPTSALLPHRTWGPPWGIVAEAVVTILALTWAGVQGIRTSGRIS